MGGLGFWGDFPVWIEVCYGFNWLIHLFILQFLYFPCVPGFSNFVFLVLVFRRSGVPAFRRSGIPAFHVLVQATVFRMALKTWKCFRFHATPDKLKRSNLSVWDSGTEIIWLLGRHRFWKTPQSKCFSSTLKHRKGMVAGLLQYLTTYNLYSVIQIFVQ